MAAPGLVIIECDEARVFRALKSGTEPAIIRSGLRPSDSAIPFSERTPPNPEYFSAIASALGDTGVLQVFGRGPNSGAEVEALIAWLDAYQPEIAARVIFSQVVPDRFSSDTRLLTQARNYLASQTPTLSAG